jgi:hypothetical protein
MASGSWAIGLVALSACASAGREDITIHPDAKGSGSGSDAEILIDAPLSIDAPTPIDAAPQPVTMLETTSQTVAQGNSFNCNAANVTAENSYYRVFTLADFGVTTTLHVTNVTFLVESAVAGAGGQQPAQVKLGTYAGTIGAVTLDLTKVTAVNAASIMIPDSTGGTVSTPITADIPGGSNLIVEIFIPDGMAANNVMFIGSNNGGENKPGYIRAPTCSLATPTTMKSIAAAQSPPLPEPDILITVSGTH